MESVGGGLISRISDQSSAEMNTAAYSEDFRTANYSDNDTYYMLPPNATVYPNCSYDEDGVWVTDGVECCWNGTHLVCTDPVEFYSLGFKVAIVILYNSIFVTAVLGNALVCYVVFSSPRMRTVTNYLIANLAVGDLLMAILCVPFSYIPVLLQYWPFGHLLCYILPTAQAIGVLISSYTLVALAADRYMAILYPLRPRFRRSQACWVIAGVWIVAIITSSPIAIFTEYFYDETRGNGNNYYCEEVKLKILF